MTKRIHKTTVYVLLLIVLVFSVFPGVSARADAQNFTARRTYGDSFTDVKASDWFYTYVRQGYEFGLVNGKSDTSFAPGDNVTLAEVITLAARVHSIYTSGNDEFPAATDVWYQPYVDYALNEGIISATYSDYSAAAARNEVAAIFSKSLPADALAAIGTVEDNALPDVKMTDRNAAAIYMLYRAGVLAGNDGDGTFAPQTNIRRSEIATIVVRVADAKLRSANYFTTGGRKELTATQIAEKCSAAVFFVDVIAPSGHSIATASGFFITSDGMALTNYHVIDSAAALKITTTDGKTYPVTGVYGYDALNDIALIQVDGTGFKTLTLGDSDAVKQGETVYTLGSPRGLDNTLSQGLVSNAKRVFEDGSTYIQMTAPISPGSSGGALINTYGEAVGISTGGDPTANSIFFAVPVNLTKSLPRIALYAFYDTMHLYSYPRVDESIDFGYYASINETDIILEGLKSTYTYDMAAFADGDFYALTILYYEKELEEWGYTRSATSTENLLYYSCETSKLTLTLDYTKRLIKVEIVQTPFFSADFPTLPDFEKFTQTKFSDRTVFMDGAIGYTLDYYSWGYNDEMFANYLLAPYLGVLEESGITLVNADIASGSILCEGKGVSVVILLTDTGEVYFDVKKI
ncbi:MAG: trypsin-like peptidase domain-containing protein [Oscillospiraceae bacterium]|jgi:S1-C subfamily serine protease|nr:trypsin-like peptidase domain-containing protein [Oscillospiraceae bacterium]